MLPLPVNCGQLPFSELPLPTGDAEPGQKKNYLARPPPAPAPPQKNASAPCASPEAPSAFASLRRPPAFWSIPQQRPKPPAPQPPKGQKVSGLPAPSPPAPQGGKRFQGFQPPAPQPPRGQKVSGLPAPSPQPPKKRNVYKSQPKPPFLFQPSPAKRAPRPLPPFCRPAFLPAQPSRENATTRPACSPSPSQRPAAASRLLLLPLRGC